jgi:hypothetical protein
VLRTPRRRTERWGPSAWILRAWPRGLGRGRLGAAGVPPRKRADLPFLPPYLYAPDCVEGLFSEVPMAPVQQEGGLIYRGLGYGPSFLPRL